MVLNFYNAVPPRSERDVLGVYGREMVLLEPFVAGWFGSQSKESLVGYRICLRPGQAFEDKEAQESPHCRPGVAIQFRIG